MDAQGRRYGIASAVAFAVAMVFACALLWGGP